MGRLPPCAALLLLLLSGGAEATLVKKGDGRSTGPAPGGVDVGVPSGRVRVQCWQDGRKIIDETDLSIVSLSIASQLNGLHFRRNREADGSLSVVAQARTACLLGGRE